MNKAAGFTLIELVVVVAIVGILSAIAISSYKESVAKGHRSEAMAALVENAQQLERYFSVSGRYTTNTGDTTPASAGMTLTKVPVNGAAYYNISGVTNSDTTYTLTAAPTGSMTGDKCGSFTLTQAGVRDVTGGTALAADCWRR